MPRTAQPDELRKVEATEEPYVYQYLFRSYYRMGKTSTWFPVTPMTAIVFVFVDMVVCCLNLWGNTQVVSYSFYEFF
jgi:hypothetical protein